MAAFPATSGGARGSGSSPEQGDSWQSGNRLPPKEDLDGPYELDFARSAEDLEAIQRLRYEVFNLELREGLDASRLTGLDQDPFDAACDHLYIRFRESGEIVGTYRMQTRETARTGLGFYSATEYDLSGLPASMLDHAVEIGRACIHRDHRSLKVLYLLWKGLGRYASFHHKRYLFGCCSLTSQDPAEGWSVYRQLESAGQLHPEWRVEPLESHTCSVLDVSESVTKLPRLMRTYLSLGATICSMPAIDREFKTIDFLAVFDFDTLQQSDLAFYRFRS